MHPDCTDDRDTRKDHSAHQAHQSGWCASLFSDHSSSTLPEKMTGAFYDIHFKTGGLHMRAKTFDNMYRGLPLNTTAKGHDGYYVEVLEAIYKVMTYMYNNYDNVFMTQFTLTYPVDVTTQENENNLSISRCCWNIIRALRAEGINGMFVWGREQSSSENPHYHLMLLVDGGKVQDTKMLEPMVNHYWQKCIDVQCRKNLTFPSDYNVPKCGVRIPRNLDSDSS